MCPNQQLSLCPTGVPGFSRLFEFDHKIHFSGLFQYSGYHLGIVREPFSLFSGNDYLCHFATVGQPDRIDVRHSDREEEVFELLTICRVGLCEPDLTAEDVLERFLQSNVASQGG